MSKYFMVCADCDHQFSVPVSEGDPFKQVCPNCSSKNICQRFGVENSICIDKMKECSSCPFEGNCNAS